MKNSENFTRKYKTLNNIKIIYKKKIIKVKKHK